MKKAFFIFGLFLPASLWAQSKATARIEYLQDQRTDNREVVSEYLLKRWMKSVKDSAGFVEREVARANGIISQVNENVYQLMLIRNAVGEDESLLGELEEIEAYHKEAGDFDEFAAFGISNGAPEFKFDHGSISEEGSISYDEAIDNLKNWTIWEHSSDLISRNNPQDTLVLMSVLKILDEHEIRVDLDADQGEDVRAWYEGNPDYLAIFERRKLRHEEETNERIEVLGENGVDTNRENELMVHHSDLVKDFGICMENVRNCLDSHQRREREMMFLMTAEKLESLLAETQPKSEEGRLLLSAAMKYFIELSLALYYLELAEEEPEKFKELKKEGQLEIPTFLSHYREARLRDGDLKVEDFLKKNKNYVARELSALLPVIKKYGVDVFKEGGDIVQRVAKRQKSLAEETHEMPQAYVSTGLHVVGDPRGRAISAGADRLIKSMESVSGMQTDFESGYYIWHDVRTSDVITEINPLYKFEGENQTIIDIP